MTDTIVRVLESIKSFRGTAQDNSRDWCDRAEIIFNAFNVNDADRLSRIGVKLEDSAFDWYRNNPGPYATWAAFRQTFQQAFPPPERTRNPHLLAEQINQRKQGPDESVHDYYYALDKLCREYDPQMSLIDKTIKLVGGLREDLKEKILPLNVQTPEQFMIQAKNFESSQKVMSHHRKVDQPVEFTEPSYVFESNNYSTIAASQPNRQRWQHQQQQYQQPLNYQQYQQPLNYQQYQQPSNYQPYQQPSNYQQNQQPNYKQNHQNSQYQYHHRSIQTPQRVRNHLGQDTTTQRTQMSIRPQQSMNQQRHVQQPTGQSSADYQTNTGSYSNVNQLTCFNCGQVGHLKRNCSFHLNLH